MTLAAGTRLGPYEIVSPLGAGGMGEVYRAKDAKLEREVAIKVLPGNLSEDPQALARFEREAKAVAALSHPNILAIHDFGRHEGIAYAVSELLQGETLRARLASGALPARKAIDYAVQIAHGLAAAHGKGIVHRDLKPENLFVTKDGHVKILDFGLASWRPLDAAGREQAAASHDPMVRNGLTALPTLDGPLTEPGTVMGTVGYMSPEQVRGKPADHRSDIFSFGAVLYEMLSGRRAFQGESAAETMAAIAKEDPPKIALSSSGIPAGLDEMVHRCLEKNPEERFHSAHDLAFALQALAGGASGPVSVAGYPAPSRGRRRVTLAALGLALALAGFFAGRIARWAPARADAGPRAMSFQQLTDAPGVESQPSLSPDGKSVVYVSRAVGKLDLYLLRVGGKNPTRLTADSPADDWQPAFSPDGERIAFRSERAGGGIFLMGSTGESARRLTDSGFSPSWSPDGREIVVSPSTFSYPTDIAAGARGLSAVNVETGARRTVLEGQLALQPSWSPHGKRIAFWGLRQNSGQRDLWTVAADGREAKTGAWRSPTMRRSTGARRGPRTGGISISRATAAAR